MSRGFALWHFQHYTFHALSRWRRLSSSIWCPLPSLTMIIPQDLHRERKLHLFQRTWCTPPVHWLLHWSSREQQWIWASYPTCSSYPQHEHSLGPVHGSGWFYWSCIIVRKLMFCPSYHTHTTLQTPVMKWCWRLPILRMEPMGPHILLLEASVPALPLRTSNTDEKMVQTRGLWNQLSSSSVNLNGRSLSRWHLWYIYVIIRTSSNTFNIQVLEVTHAGSSRLSVRKPNMQKYMTSVIKEAPPFSPEPQGWQCGLHTLETRDTPCIITVCK